MPSLAYDDFAGAVANSAAITVVKDDRRIVLRRRDAAGNYSPAGTYAAEYITLPNLTATGLVSIFGFEVYGSLNGGTVEAQLSGDGGTNWLYYNNGWVAANPAVAAQWSTPSVVRTNIATFPFNNGSTRSVQVRLKLSPDSAGKNTPAVDSVWFFVEYNYDPIIDFYRSAKTFLEGARYDLYTVEKSDGTNKVTLSTDFTVDNAKPIVVYNTTDEAARKTNLFQAYDAGTGVVTLSAAQDANDLLRIEYQGTVPVFIVADELYYSSQIPSLELQVSASTDFAMSGNICVEVNEDSSVGRTRFGPRYLRVQVGVSILDKDLERSLLMAKEIRRLLFEERFTSRATAQVWHIGDVSPGIDKINMSSGIYGAEMTAVVWIREDYEKYEESTLVKNLGIWVTDLNRSWYEKVTKS